MTAINCIQLPRMIRCRPCQNIMCVKLLKYRSTERRGKESYQESWNKSLEVHPLTLHYGGMSISRLATNWFSSLGMVVIIQAGYFLDFCLGFLLSTMNSIVFHTKRCYEKINRYVVVTPSGDVQQLMG